MDSGSVLAEWFRKNHQRAHRLKAKFHYAILVAHRSEADRSPVTDLLARC